MIAFPELIGHLDIKKHKRFVHFSVLGISILSILIGLVAIGFGLYRNITKDMLAGLVWTMISMYLLIGWYKQKRTYYFPFMTINFIINFVSVPGSIIAIIYELCYCNFGKACYANHCNFLVYGLGILLLSFIHLIINLIVWSHFDFIAAAKRLNPNVNGNSLENVA